MAAVVLVVFIASADARDPSTPAMLQAARDAAGPDAHVVLKTFTARPSEDEAAAAGESEHASLVAEIVWADAQHLHATLHVRPKSASRWIDRELGFQAGDAPAERGRTIGFALASMLPERTAEPAPAPAPPPPGPAQIVVVTEPSRAPERPPVVAPPPSPPVRGTVEASAIGSVGIGGSGGGIGASLAGRYFLAPGLALHLGGALRAG